MKNVIVRSISGSIYVAALVSAILIGKAWLAVLLCLLTVLGQYEFIKMTCRGKYPRLLTFIDICMGIMLVLSSFFFFTNHMPTARVMFILFGSLWVARLVAQLYEESIDAVESLSHSFFSQFYVAVPMAMIPLLRYELTTPHIVLALLIFIWVNDTGAFCAGSMIGRRKLFERISPKKTWEGFFGGMVFCIIAAAVMRGCFPSYFDSMTYGMIIRLSIVVSIFSTFGDLLESLIKRTVGVKDSGNIIPGHGGILDRIDSLLLVIPISIVYFLINI